MDEIKELREKAERMGFHDIERSGLVVLAGENGDETQKLLRMSGEMRYDLLVLGKTPRIFVFRAVVSHVSQNWRGEAYPIYKLPEEIDLDKIRIVAHGIGDVNHYLDRRYVEKEGRLDTPRLYGNLVLSGRPIVKRYGGKPVPVRTLKRMFGTGI